MEHRFRGTPFTVGIEEELMLIDPSTLELAQGIETILDDLGDEFSEQVKPELMQSVLEIATVPHESVADAALELRSLRETVRGVAERNGMVLAASGTHPTALWEEQLIVERPRYEELVAELGFIARQELIFGTHVHVGVTGPNKAIYVADSIRKHLPLLLALSANSPLWRGHVTGMMSSRTPVFRAFPRVGIPPHYGSWEIYSRRVKLMMDAGVIPDYTYLWFDVRPHPKLGTVEVRVFDQQTRFEHCRAGGARRRARAPILDPVRRSGAAGRGSHRADRRQQGARGAARHRRRAGRLPTTRTVPGDRDGEPVARGAARARAGGRL